LVGPGRRDSRSATPFVPGPRLPDRCGEAGLAVALGLSVSAFQACHKVRPSDGLLALQNVKPVRPTSTSAGQSPDRVPLTKARTPRQPFRAPLGPCPPRRRQLPFRPLRCGRLFDVRLPREWPIPPGSAPAAHVLPASSGEFQKRIPCATKQAPSGFCQQLVHVDPDNGRKDSNQVHSDQMAFALWPEARESKVPTAIRLRGSTRACDP
jgi:hypothetical protein